MWHGTLAAALIKIINLVVFFFQSLLRSTVRTVLVTRYLPLLSTFSCLRHGDR